MERSRLSRLFPDEKEESASEEDTAEESEGKLL